MKKFIKTLSKFFDKLGTGSEMLHKIKAGSFWSSGALALIFAFIPGFKIPAIVLASIAGVMLVDSCFEGTTQYGSKICDNISDFLYDKAVGKEKGAKVEKVAVSELDSVKEKDSSCVGEDDLIKKAEIILEQFPEMDPEDALAYVVKGYSVETLKAKLDSESSTIETTKEK